MFYCEILSGVWISDIDVMYNKEFLVDHSIDIIMNCTSHYNFPENKLQKIRIPISETMNERDSQLLRQNMDKIIQFIDDSINDKHILICCYDGKIISPLLVACYIKKQNNRLNDTSIIESLKTKNSDITFPYSLSMFIAS